MHTDAAQMIGKGQVDVQDLGVDYLTIVGHKVQCGSSLFGPFPAVRDVPASRSCAPG